MVGRRRAVAGLAALALFVPVLALGASPAVATVPYTWVQRSPAVSPQATYYASDMAYDSARHVSVLFGGFGGGFWNNYTWEWNGTTWTQRHPATSPSGRCCVLLAYDAFRHVTVLFGGDGENVLLSDTWEWDGTTWTRMSPATSPPARAGEAMAYDSARHVIVMYGGNGKSGDLSDTWEWNGSTWTQRHPATSPPARSTASMAYDSARQRTVLFGGDNGHGGFDSDTWEWDGTTWTRMSPATSPPGRNWATMAYDSATQMTVLFGGYNGHNLGDTWAWNGSGWTRLAPAASPPPRTQQAMDYDSARGVIVLWGGIVDAGATSDATWELQTTPVGHLSMSRTTGSFDQPVTISGTGFGPNEVVNVYGDVGISSPVYAAVTDSGGAFVIKRHVVPQPYGSRTYTAVGETSHTSASTTFVMKAGLQLRPAEGIAGETIGVTGHGYGVGETVKLRWDTPTGPIVRQDVTNNRGSVFSFFVVPTGATPGQHLVYATGTQTRAQVVATFTVQSGT